ncbi:glycoside hydrolase family 18 protein [Streptomonospora sp. PA3]|uniref:glycoside hydrolase family 18 protein n=1 Tax=Streptomonospora sp. PA3 TaxID=2607326 RepID=UPI0012DF8695|nr:glycoside hydrolase family 18 protein [Streptomonospora sp. PA3]MUL40245.1 glycoside hydrolase family 18 protein [Streptomonospora sp. PA3]
MALGRAHRRWRDGPRAARRRPGLLLGVAAAALAACLAAGVLAAVEAVRGGPGTVHRIAYFADWNIASRGYRVADVADSGAAARLTRLMWAFGEISASGRCHIPPDRAWQLYQRRYGAGDSVDAEADSYDQRLAGGLNQLRKLREQYSDLGASISLGGWNTSRHFSTAARTEESREEFVSSCVDLWLRGDLPVRGGEPQGGPGAAAGVFDGIDLDWEWPGGDGHRHNVEHPADRRNFTLLVGEFRRQLDALEEETGREYTLSASLPGDPERMREGYEPEAFRPLDFATVQGYDLAGPWSEVTGHHAQLYASEQRPDAPNVHDVVHGYLDHGLPAEKLVVGFPAFGRGWRGVDPGRAGEPGAPVEGPAEGDYGEGAASYERLEQRDGRRVFDSGSVAQALIDGGEWWSYDTPEVVRRKGDYVREYGLGGLMMWNLDMDPSGELVRAMAGGLALRDR